MVDFLNRKGVQYIMLDTDGYCMDIIPLFIESGITGRYPFEWHTGMRVEEVRKKFPDVDWEDFNYYRERLNSIIDRVAAC